MPHQHEGLPQVQRTDGRGERRARVTTYLRAYEFLRSNKDFTLANAAVLGRLLPKGILELTEDTWTPFVKSLEHCIESQTMVSDIASLGIPVDLIYGALGAFVAPGSLRVVERMRHVTTHRVEANDHIVRSRIAKVLVRVIDGEPEDHPAARSVPAVAGPRG
ncbi:hypothetical protein [Cryobacterium adonitolivorans]|uniref:hypothetical protein n=1 Tax=Cryobacterium adonitolivorans TaxID=1259189 RepID=UPI001F54765C|nr:hypothetical protein [Cryobacterium adonitolivorans]